MNQSLVNTCHGGSRISRWHMAICTRSNHASTLLRGKILCRISWFRPISFAKFIASMVAEKGADPHGAEISHSKTLTPRENNRICQDNGIGIFSTLQITKDKLSTANMIREMTERLHNSRPGS